MAKTHDYGLSRNSKSKGGKSNTGYPSNNNRNSYGYGGARPQNNARGNYSKPVNTAPPTAPYNFVKLNKSVVQAPLAERMADAEGVPQKSVAFAQFINEEGKYSGYFDVTVKNLTPLYIGSESGFFSDGKNYIIPGSSLRGCMKNIFKIITASSFRSDKDNPDITDRRLYFRSLAGKFREIRDLYTGRMSTTDEQGRAHSVALGGFLVREKNTYYIIPAEVTPQKGVYVNWHTKNPSDFPNKEVRVYVGVNATPGSRDGMGGKSCVRWHNDSVDMFTGALRDKKTFYRFSNPHWNKKLEIPKDMVEDYRNDESRGRYDLLQTKEALDGAAIKTVKYTDNPYNDIECIAYEMISNGKLKTPKRIMNFSPDKRLLRSEIESQKNRYAGSEKPADKIKFLQNCSQYDRIIPCFYTADSNGAVTGFGATPYFRIRYQKAISEHIPSVLKEDTIDLTDAVFGSKGDWAGRVYFEDLFAEADLDDAFEPSALHKVLSGANPTSFQMYLETKNNKAASWDGDSLLRGYKLYWHKQDSWQAAPDVKQQMTTEISPLKKGQIFKGRIRFEHLDAVELGAMCYLFALGKENGICFKLGGGKPIGMGTVKITAELVLQSGEYYTQLFDAEGFAAGRAEANLDDFKNKFADYMKDELQKAGNNEFALYKERMQELRLIMSTANMQKPNWNENTRYMSINDRKDKDIYSARTPLPGITEVYKG